ncbi:hypothetical protein L2221_18020, partial [Xanthomonas perforans]|nr:hypothetical protein [Xanthomonas perforans]
HFSDAITRDAVRYNFAVDPNFYLAGDDEENLRGLVSLIDEGGPSGSLHQFAHGHKPFRKLLPVCYQSMFCEGRDQAPPSLVPLKSLDHYDPRGAYVCLGWSAAALYSR